MRTTRPLLSVLLLAFSATAQTGKITAREAKEHIGEVQTVCGKVVSAHYAVRSKGQPTFLNLDEPYPKQIHDLDLGQRPREIRGSRIEVQRRERMRQREDQELSRSGGDHCDRAEPNHPSEMNFSDAAPLSTKTK